eukprot:g1455.t1
MIRRSNRIATNRDKSIGSICILANGEPLLLKFIIAFLDAKATKNFITSSIVKIFNSFMDKTLYDSDRIIQFFVTERSGRGHYSDMINNYILSARSNHSMYYLSVFSETQMILYKDAFYCKLKAITYGSTNLPLVSAAGKNSPVHVEILVEGGEDVNKAHAPDGITPLLNAISNNNIHIVKKLLTYDSIDINRPGKCKGRKYWMPERSVTPLFKAILDNHGDITKTLLRHKSIDVNRGRTDTEETPLHVAATVGNNDVVKLILKQKSIDVNKVATDHAGETPLCAAARAGHVTIVKSLLTVESIDVNKARIDNGETPLYTAATNGHLTAVKLLLKHESIGSYNGYTPLLTALNGGSSYSTRRLSKNYVDIVTLLLKHETINVIKASTEDGVTALYTAAKKGHTNFIKILFSKCKFLDVNNARMDNGETPLYAAACAGHINVVKLLLKLESIDVNKARTDNGKTPLYAAADAGHTNMVKLLLNIESIDVNKARIDRGETPLFTASESGFSDIVQVLLQHESIGSSIDVNKASADNGKTALYVAVARKHTKIVKLLLKHESIEVDKARTDTGATPFFKAAETGCVEVLQLLKDSGADVHTKLTKGNYKNANSIFAAAWQGKIKSIKLLLSWNIDSDKSTDNGVHPIHAAIRNNHLSAAKFLFFVLNRYRRKSFIHTLNSHEFSKLLKKVASTPFFSTIVGNTVQNNRGYRWGGRFH